MMDAQLINYAYKGLRHHCEKIDRAITEETISESEFKRQLDEVQRALTAYRGLIFELKQMNVPLYRDVIFRDEAIKYIRESISGLREAGEEKFAELMQLHTAE